MSSLVDLSSNKFDMRVYEKRIMHPLIFNDIIPSSDISSLLLWNLVTTFLEYSSSKSTFSNCSSCTKLIAWSYTPVSKASPKSTSKLDASHTPFSKDESSLVIFDTHIYCLLILVCEIWCVNITFESTNIQFSTTGYYFYMFTNYIVNYK
jgi:hypothetical protein